MRKSLAAIGMSLAAAAVLVTPMLGASPVAASSDQVAPAQQQSATPIRKTTRREPHPEIRRAITALEKAKYALQHAAHDFGGHRADALAATDRAIEQLRLALQYDKQ
jgi:hypothetical protein